MTPEYGAAPTPPVGATAIATGDEKSYVDWPAIIGGAVLATAISVVLLAFGSALGLSFTSAYEGSGMSLAAFAIAAALWLIWVQVSAFMAGGYLAGRLRRRNYDATEDESDIRDGSHGLLVWGLGVLVGAVIAFSSASAVLGTATNAVGSAVGGAASGAATLADNIDPNTLLSDRLLRPGTATDTANADLRDEVGRILLTAVADGELAQDDRDYLASVVAARTGTDEAEAQARVDQVWAQAQELEATAREAAERARRVTMVAAFITAASLLISAAGAYFGAVTGGNHRDRQTVVQGWVRPW
ncbi:MAG: hypothetical protein ABW191_08990 [Aliihoeflea sp.]